MRISAVEDIKGPLDSFSCERVEASGHPTPPTHRRSLRLASANVTNDGCVVFCDSENGRAISPPLQIALRIGVRLLVVPSSVTSPHTQARVLDSIVAPRTSRGLHCSGAIAVGGRPGAWPDKTGGSTPGAMDIP